MLRLAAPLPSSAAARLALCRARSCSRCKNPQLRGVGSLSACDASKRCVEVLDSTRPVPSRLCSRPLSFTARRRSCFGLCLIPARFLALSFAVIAFSLIASTGTKTTEVGDVRILGRSYKAFRTLAYVVASNVIVAVYALCVGIGGTLVRFGCARTTDVSKVVMSYFIQLGDLSLSFLQFGAATAVAGLRGGFSDLRTSYDYCSTNDSFCRSACAALRGSASSELTDASPRLALRPAQSSWRRLSFRTWRGCPSFQI